MRSPRSIAAALVVAVTSTILVAVTGGVSAHVYGLRVGLTTWSRPLVASLLLLAWYVRATGRADALALARLALAAVTLAGVGYWATYLVTVCGGSDSYGYVSGSLAILDLRLVQPQPIATWLPVVNPLDVATPAGWVPAAGGLGIAPQYPLGFPFLMAIATLVGGERAAFVVPLACGAMCLVVVFQIARSAYGLLAAWLAAALLAWTPIMVAYAKQPMSDVPAAMWLLIAAWAALGPPQRPTLAGLASGASFVTRPGGIGACVVVGLFAAWTGPSKSRAFARFLLGVAPFVLLQAVVQWRLFGHPLTSGYGALSSVYGGLSIAGNLSIYARAMWATETPLWAAAVAASLIAAPRRTVLLGLAVFVGSALPYLLYLPFDHWETLRFLLPGLALLTVAAAGGLVLALARYGRRDARIAALVIAAAAAFAMNGERYLRTHGTPTIYQVEARYPDVAAYLQRNTPDNAVVFAAQHSGSIRYYAGRITLRWDLLRPADLRPALAAIAGRGSRTFVALEGDERGRFIERFEEPLRTVSMLPLGQVDNVQMWELVL
jgi:hypothetical protein